jgi:signal transduction histidine kinase
MRHFLTGGALPTGKVFERFYRVSTDRGEIGAGLGLAIVKSIVHAHGGSVSLCSVNGTGSRFTVEVPLWKNEPTMAPSGK